MNEILKILTFIILTIITLWVTWFSKLTESNLSECLSCTDYIHGEPYVENKGKVKSIKTYKSKSYQHKLSSFEKNDPIRMQFKNTKSDSLIIIDGESFLISEFYQSEDMKSINEIHYNDSGNIMYEGHFNFDASGNLIEKEIYADPFRTGYGNILRNLEYDNIFMKTDSNFQELLKINYTYINDGTSLNKRNHKQKGIQYHKYEYDEDKRIVTHFISDSLESRNKTYRIDFKYMKTGCLRESQKIELVGENIFLLQHYKYEFDNSGCLDKVIYIDEFAETTIECNSDLTRKSEKRVSRSGQVTELDYYYKFDKAGNWNKIEITEKGDKLKDITVFKREFVYYEN